MPSPEQEFQSPQASGSEKVLSYYLDKKLQEESKMDAILWKAFLSDSTEAFSEIFIKYNPRLVTMGLKLGFEKKTIEDAIQDLFLELWRKRHQLAEVSSVKYYLVVAIRRALISQQEKKIRLLKLVMGIRLQDPVIELPEILEEDVNAWRLAQITKSINLLPQRQMQAVTLRYIEEKSYPEIASIMEVDVGSVRKFVHKGVKAIKKALTTHLNA